MPLDDAPVPWQEQRPATQAEQLTARFYDWERRGRGWQVWPYPVQLEPPFRPFLGHFLSPQAPYDDARKPTMLSTLADRVRERFLGRPSNPEWLPAIALDALGEPEPEFFLDDAGLVEIRVALPPQVKVTPHLAEQFLLSLRSCAYPLSFEVLGLPNAIIVQLAGRSSDAGHIRKQLRAFFPDAGLEEANDFLETRWRTHVARIIVDFGLSQEFMRPLRPFPSFEVDPLIGIVGALGDIAPDEFAVLQVLFEATRYPWSESIARAVTAWDGRPFFEDAPEMTALAREKSESPMFAAVIRVAAQSPEPLRAHELVRALGGALGPLSSPGRNELIPLENDDYDFEAHEDDLLSRRTHRSGLIVNSAELVSLVHPPSVSVRAEKLARENRKTKAAPAIAEARALVLGENVHQGKTALVGVSREQRLRHMHVVGATGTGKSTLLVNLIMQDIAHGNGVGVIDPHGDLVEEVLGRVPEPRWNDVVLFDPADTEFPVGFNILSADSELEKTILISDLGTVFKRFSTSWGDQMTSLLGNAISAFVESSEGGSLVDLRRFLIEPDFRKRFLATVKDPEIRYFWEKEFSLLKGTPQASILTRLDTFLRPKPVRNIVAQKESRLRFPEILNGGKILLVKLAQGLIGEENAHLLGAFLVSKLHQVVMARQEIAATERRDFFLFIDEFQNFITPSLASMLSGARKYGLGLILAHQELRQLWSRDPDVASAVVANPATRVSFRLGDFDAQKLMGGFASFDAKDLQSLGVGEAIIRLGQADNDCNLRTLPLPPVHGASAKRAREQIIALSRERYATPKAAVEAGQVPEPEAEREPLPPVAERSTRAPKPRAAAVSPPIEAEAEDGETPQRQDSTPGRGGAQHKYLQALVKRFAEDKGWRVTIELPVLKGMGNVDVALAKEGVSIACEISVASTAEQELGNIQKCLAAGFSHVAVVSTETKAINGLKEFIPPRIDKEHADRVHVLVPEEFFGFLEDYDAHAAGKEDTVRGYKVRVRYRPLAEPEKKARKKAITETIARALNRLRSKS